MPVEKKTRFNLTYLLVALWGVLLIQGFIAARFRPKEIPSSTFLKALERKEVPFAGEAGVPFFSISGSEFVEMDGFDPRADVVIMAATNRPETLDPALLRPGRFDRQVLVDRPDVIGREAILRVHAKGVKLAPETDLKVIARKTPGFSGADLANAINEAALLAARKKRAAVAQEDLDEAVDRLLTGLEKKNRVINPKEKERVAEQVVFGEVSTGAHNDLQRATDTVPGPAGEAA